MWNNVKTFMLLTALTALVVGAGWVMGGRTGLAIALGLAALMNLGGYWFSDKIALSMSGAVAVSREEAPGLYRVVGALSERAGIPMPRLYVIPTGAPNAFATGRGPSHAAVAVTRGIVDLLDDEELAGVLAHELAHVRNRDILIGSVAAMLAGALTQLANIFQFGLIFGGHHDEDEGPGNVLVGLALMVVAPIAATLVQLAVSRSREFEADRTGAMITGRPEALARALMKLEAGNEVRPLHTSPATAHMWIVSPLHAGQALAGLFRTHPPTEERVERLLALKEGMRGGGRTLAPR